MATRAFAYRIAGLQILIDTPLPVLEPFRGDDAPAAVFPSIAADDLNPIERWEAEGWVGGVRQRVMCTRVASGYVLAVQDFSFFVAENGLQIALTQGRVDSSISSILLGPIVIFALALQERWCLHGSAIQVQDGVVLFIGESGSGKSTTAAWLSESQSQLRRIADDVVPVAIERQRLVCFPSFPQLKLRPRYQYKDHKPIAVSRIYILDPKPAGELVVQSPSPSEAAMGLARHTVAARLFSQTLLSKHLTFCSQLIEKTRIIHLDYPHIESSLGRVYQLVA